MKSDEMIVVRTCPSEVEAEIMLGHLASNGIEAFIAKDDSGGMRPHLQLTQGVDVVVHRKDLKKAEQVLRARNV
jgi:hypothetical protein